MNIFDKIEPEKKKILEQTKALLTGHFRLSSGRHSQYYFQCARLLQYPEITRQIAEELAQTFKEEQIDVVVSPAVGAIILGYELARLLGCRAVFTERQEGKMTLRRGFEIYPGENVLIAEDVITTGGSVLEIKELLIHHRQVKIKGFVAIVDRSRGKFKPEERFVKWLTLELENYTPEECPLCKKGLELIYPGSRTLTS